MGKSLARKIIDEHLVAGEAKAGSEIGLRIDQTLTQDATGTMAYLQFEAMGIPRVRTKLSVSYVDDNMLQAGFENADDHRFLQNMAAKYGIVLPDRGTDMPSGAPGAVQRPRADAHRLGQPHTDRRRRGHAGDGRRRAGRGAGDGGRAVLSMMPQVVRVNLTGRLPAWVAAKDVILEMLRRLTVKGGVGRIFEYGGEGAATLSVPERANNHEHGRGAGSNKLVFPSDERTREYLRAQKREKAWYALAADVDAEYDEVIEIDLNKLEPLIALPSSPDKVVPVTGGRRDGGGAGGDRELHELVLRRLDRRWRQSPRARWCIRT